MPKFLARHEMGCLAWVSETVDLVNGSLIAAITIGYMCSRNYNQIQLNMQCTLGHTQFLGRPNYSRVPNRPHDGKEKFTAGWKTI